MVDALRRASSWITPAGLIVDLHPTADVARVMVGGRVAGSIDPGGAATRHQRASDAIDAAVREGWLTMEDAAEFTFATYADSLDELSDHILADWRDARIGEATMDAARTLLQRHPGEPVMARERVAAVRLRR